jgi:diacylglycerol kinase family enzyme
VTSVEQADQSRRCAVVYNPTKVSDKFHALVEDSLQRNGWSNPLWLETSVEDPGRTMTRQAVAEHVDLVIGAGGDGTIRFVADGLAHTGIPMGVIGNVGTLRGNMTLIPGASPDDGLLDLYIASPRRFRHWVKVALRLITRRPKKDDQVDQHMGKRVRITIHGKDNYQLDGDVVGESTTLDAEIQPGALMICVPAQAASEA